MPKSIKKPYRNRGGRGSNQYATKGNPTTLPRLDPATAAELGEDVEDVAWVFDPHRPEWEQLNVERADAQRLLQAGITASGFRRWGWAASELPVDEILDWHAGELSASDARQWSAQGFRAEMAARWTRAGFSPARAQSWNRQDRWADRPEEAGTWLAFHPERNTVTGSDARRAARWAGYGFSPQEAHQWDRQGITAVRAAKWRDLGLSPREAKAREDAEDAAEGTLPADESVSVSRPETPPAG